VHCSVVQASGYLLGTDGSEMEWADVVVLASGSSYKTEDLLEELKVNLYLCCGVVVPEAQFSVRCPEMLLSDCLGW